MTDQFWYPLFLFPAIPLMMTTFGNRWISLSALIRKTHDQILAENIQGQKRVRYLDELKILNKRVMLVMMMQTLSALSFILNLLTIFFGYLQMIDMATICFGVAVVLFMIAIITFIVEIQLSVGALKKYLEDLEDL
jgi:Zn-dependent membrane protease YugP